MVDELKKNESLGDLGEARILSRLAGFGGCNARVTCGIGDDCSVCRTENPAVDQVFTSDATIEGIHFRIDEDPVRVGRKAVSRVLSDIASMGASPDMTSMFMGQNGNTNSTSKTSSSSRMSGSNTKTVSNENRTFTPPSGIDELLNSLESNNDSGNDNVTLDIS